MIKWFDPKENPVFALRDVKTPKNPVRAPKKFDVTKEQFDPIGMVGTGSFGTIHLVKDRFRGYCCLKKLIKRDDAGYTGMASIKERDALVQLDHPFIVDIFYAFQTENFAYLAIEYIPIGDIADFRKKKTAKSGVGIYSRTIVGSCRSQ
jgi:serine/threonine protein kinase